MIRRTLLPREIGDGLADWHVLVVGTLLVGVATVGAGALAGAVVRRARAALSRRRRARREPLLKVVRQAAPDGLSLYEAFVALGGDARALETMRASMAEVGKAERFPGDWSAALREGGPWGVSLRKDWVARLACRWAMDRVTTDPAFVGRGYEVAEWEEGGGISIMDSVGMTPALDAAQQRLFEECRDVVKGVAGKTDPYLCAAMIAPIEGDTPDPELTMDLDEGTGTGGLGRFVRGVPGLALLLFDRRGIERAAAASGFPRDNLREFFRFCERFAPKGRPADGVGSGAFFAARMGRAWPGVGLVLVAGAGGTVSQMTLRMSLRSVIDRMQFGEKELRLLSHAAATFAHVAQGDYWSVLRRTLGRLCGIPLCERARDAAEALAPKGEVEERLCEEHRLRVGDALERANRTLGRLIAVLVFLTRPPAAEGVHRALELGGYVVAGLGEELLAGVPEELRESVRRAREAVFVRQPHLRPGGPRGPEGQTPKP